MAAAELKSRIDYLDRQIRSCEDQMLKQLGLNTENYDNDEYHYQMWQHHSELVKLDDWQSYQDLNNALNDAVKEFNDKRYYEIA